jgi:RNA polymerase sigma-70 factor (sigma-E family)
MTTRLPVSADEALQESLRGAFERDYSSLVALGIALTSHRDIAEDLVQEAFVRAAGKLAQLSPTDSRQYLRRVVINLWKNRLRRLAIERKHAPSRSASVPPLDLGERDLVWRCIQRLPFRQRCCVVLRFYEDLSEKQVAAVLGCSAGTVKSHTSRALVRLRKELKDGAGTEDPRRPFRSSDA